MTQNGNTWKRQSRALVMQTDKVLVESANLGAKLARLPKNEHFTCNTTQTRVLLCPSFINMVAARRIFDADCMLEHGLCVIGHKLVADWNENCLNFKAAFGANPRACADLWKDMWDDTRPEITIGPDSQLDHFFHCLHFLCVCPAERNMAANLAVDRGSMMHAVREQATMMSLVKNRKVREVAKTAFVMHKLSLILTNRLACQMWIQKTFSS